MQLPTQTFTFTLLTPCFSGTALGKLANCATMRIPPIRGHIRFWHRKLFGAKSAGAIWGNTEGANAGASRIGLSFESNPASSSRQERLLPHADPTSHNHQERRKAESFAYAIPEGTSFTLMLRRYPACTNEDWDKAVKAIKCWLLLGAVGLRSNRAAGSVWPMDPWTPTTCEALTATLQEIGFNSPVQIAGLNGNFSIEALRETASDTVGGTGTNHPQFGGIRPRKPSPTKFKVIKLGEQYALLIIGGQLQQAYTALMNKPNSARWQNLGSWEAL